MELTYRDNGMHDKLKLAVKDKDVLKDDSVESIDFNVGELAAAREIELNPFGYKNYALSKGGELFVQAITQQDLRHKIKFDVSIDNLPKMDGMFSGGKADPYFEIYLVSDTSEHLIIFKSDYKKNTKKAEWENICLPMKRFGVVNAHIHKKFFIKFWDWNKNGKSDYIGSTPMMMLNELTAHGRIERKILDESKDGNKAFRGDMRIYAVEVTRDF